MRPHCLLVLAPAVLWLSGCGGAPTQRVKVNADSRVTSPDTGGQPAEPDRPRRGIEKAGAVIEIDEQDPDRPVVKVDFTTAPELDGALPYLRECPKVRSLDLRGTVMDDDRMPVLARLTELRTLVLQNTECRDRGVLYLRQLTKLESLDLSATGVTECGIELLKELTGLRELYLAQTDLPDPGLGPVARFVNLEVLDLHNTQVTDAGLAHLRGLKKLRALRVDDNPGITDAGLVHLKDLTALETLHLSETKVTDAGLAHLKGLPNLRTLQVEHTKVSAKGVEDLRKALPRLEVLYTSP